MRKRAIATAALSASACLGMLLSGVAPPLISIACLLWLSFFGFVLIERRFHIPELLLGILQTVLGLAFLWLALIQERGTDLLGLLLSFACPFLLLRTLTPPTVFNDFLIVLVSLLIVAGSAAGADGLMPLVITAAYLLAASPAVLVITRRASTRNAEVTVRLLGRAGGWRSAPALAAWLVAAGGLVLGAVLYLVVPRLSEEPGIAGLGNDAAAVHGGWRSGHAGVGGRGLETGFPSAVQIGEIGRLKRNFREAFVAEVTVEARPYDPPASERTMLLLRARAWEVYDPARTSWVLRPHPARPLADDGVIEAGAAPVSWSMSSRGYEGKTLFLPQRPRRIFSAAPLAIDRLGVVTSRRVVTSYHVEAALPVTSRAGIGVLEPAQVRPELLYVPAEIEGELRRFLPRAGRGIRAATEAIHSYFEQERFRYTLYLPRLLPDKDPVVAFLERREGHCELYASAGCLFLRMMGIPARLAAGVRLSERLRPGRYRARYSNAHAWVEVKCRGVGWVAFDFTRPDSRAVPASDAPAAATRRGPDPGRPETEVPAEPSMDWREPFRYGRLEQTKLVRRMGDAISLVPLLYAAAALLGLLLLWTLAGARRNREKNPLAVSAPPGVARRTLRFYARWLRACAALGFRRTRAQTPREFLRLLPADLRREGVKVTLEFERRRYGVRGPERAAGRGGQE